MLDFEDILKKHGVSNEHDIKMVEALDIKECRETLNAKIKNYKNTIIDVSNMRKRAEEKQLLLLKKSIADNTTKRIYKRVSDEIDSILSDLKTNELIVGDSVKKFKYIFNSLEEIKHCHIKKENNIAKEFKEQCEKKSLGSSEIEMLEMYINSDKFKSIMDI